MQTPPDRLIIEAILLPLLMAVIGLIAKLFGEGTLALAFMVLSGAAILAVLLFSKYKTYQTIKYEQDKDLEKRRQEHDNELERRRQEHATEMKKEAQLADTPIFKHLHTLVHNGRDTGVRLMPVVPKYTDLIPSNLPLGSQLPILKEIESDVLQMMQKLLDTFEEILPHEKNLWVAIRDRRSDDSYHTWVRKGAFNPNRKDMSQSMHKDGSSTIVELKRNYQFEFKCVRITGTKDRCWKKMPNDDHHEDNSVLMGAVMTKSWDAEKKRWKKGHNCLSWVITINSPNHDVFNPTHIPIMQAAIDNFSWLANQACRAQHLVNQGGAPQH